MRSNGRFAVWILGGLGFILLLVWEQVTGTRLGYRVEQARASVQQQEHQNAYLRLELQKWKSPGHLSDAAHRRLGMVPASPDSVVLLQEASDEARRPTLWSWLQAKLED